MTQPPNYNPNCKPFTDFRYQIMMATQQLFYQCLQCQAHTTCPHFIYMLNDIESAKQQQVQGGIQNANPQK